MSLLRVSFDLTEVGERVGLNCYVGGRSCVGSCMCALIRLETLLVVAIFFVREAGSVMRFDFPIAGFDEVGLLFDPAPGAEFRVSLI